MEQNELYFTAAVLLFFIIAFSGLALLAYGFIKIKKQKGLAEKIDQKSSKLQPFLILGFLLVFITAVVGSTYYYSERFLPDPASEIGEKVVNLFNTTTWLTGIAFFLTQILLFFFAFLYRTKEGRKARYLKNLYKLEFTWIIIPALAFIFLFIWGQILWVRIQSPPEGEVLELDVMGEQFNWWVRYPGLDGVLGRADFRYIDEVNDMGIDITDINSLDDFVPVQVHVPKGKTVRLRLRSRDVIHNFYIPVMRIKMDAIPGMATSIHFTPTTTTAEMRRQLGNPNFDYEIACAELCGRMHFAMKMILVVDEPEEFEAWYRAQESWYLKHDDFINF